MSITTGGWDRLNSKLSGFLKLFELLRCLEATSIHIMVFFLVCLYAQVDRSMSELVGAQSGFTSFNKNCKIKFKELISSSAICVCYSDLIYTGDKSTLMKQIRT